MEWNQIPKHPYFRPTLIAVLLHLLFIGAAMAIHVHNAPPELPQEDLLKFNVKSVDLNPVSVRRDSDASNPNRTKDSIKFTKPSQKAEPNLPKDVPVEKLIEKPAAPRNDEAVVTPKRVELQDPSQDRNDDLSTVLFHTDEKQLRDEIQMQPKTTSDGASDVAKLVSEHKADAQQMVRSLSTAIKKITMPDTGNVNLDPDEGMPGFTPMEGTYGNADFDHGMQEAKGDIVKYKSLDDFLDIEVKTYQDAADGQKYFRIKIFAKPGAKELKVMPKEILFAIDCSLSISPERLDEFKRGIGQSLKNLNPEDVFNIVAFKDKAFLFSDKPIKPTPEVIKQAEQFVASLTSNRNTDVYNAFEKIIEASPSRRPSNIILISDGRPTHGVRDSRELINKVTRLNGKVRPIFAYSGGAKVNRYLLDFLAYQNRAWSQFIKDRGKIHKGLADFYSKIKDPIFLNLRYQINSLDESEVFPKTLPDFYRNAEFTIFGKYTGEDKFSMQLLGDFENETKELIFQRSLAESQKGDADIMKGYAFNKIYHLISRMTTEGQNAQLLEQIRDLSKRYGIETPYSPEQDIRD